MSLLLALATIAAPIGNQYPPFLTIELAGIDRQWTRVIALMDETPFADPATALSAWKRQGGTRRTLGKPLEALIAALNPATARRLSALNGSRLSFQHMQDDTLRWWASIPDDRGIAADLATALALTDGRAEEPLNSFPDSQVERLGSPASTLIARSGRRLALAGDRPALGAALRELNARRPAGETGIPDGSGCQIRFLPTEVTGASAEFKAVASALVKIGVQAIDAKAVIHDDEFSIQTITTCKRPTEPGRAIDRTWLAWLPADADAALSLVLYPEGDSWPSLFDAVDAYQRADPANANLAPSRLRLNLLLRAAGIQFERDVRPALLGVSIAIRSDTPGIRLSRSSWIIVTLHLDDNTSAKRIVDGLSTNLAGRFGLEVDRRGRDVVIARGRPINRDRAGSAEQPEANLAAFLVTLLQDEAPSRIGYLQAGRLARQLTSIEIPESLEEATPIVWTGRGSHDLIRSSNLRRLVQRATEAAVQDREPNQGR